MTVYRKNPLLMTVMGANPGGPQFIVIDSSDGRVMYTKRATGVGSEAIRKCVEAATRFADRAGRSYIVYLDLSRKRIGDFVNLQWIRHEGITDEIFPGGRRSNPPRRRRPDDVIDKAIEQEWYRQMSGVQVSIMDIPKIFRDVKLEMAGGVPLDQAVLSVGRQYQAGGRRINPGGLGAAVVGGIAGAVANRVLSNPRSGSVLITTPSQLEAGKVAGWLRREKVDALVDVHRGEWGVFVPPNQFGRARHALNRVLSRNPSHDPRGPIQREYGTICRKCGGHHSTIICEPARCTMCGEDRGSKGPYRVPKVGPSKGKTICDQCYRGWRSGRRSGETWAENPGRSTRKTTMPIARFAALVKKQNDPALWRDFVAKCRAYHKWSHGSWPTKVTVERINKPGVKGLWIVFDMGKQPESTYVMPKGSKRKGAWKHPWTRMPSMKGDPQAGMIITKLVSGNRLQEFLHG